MKANQINFTTPEQSKQLLELGLPAESADCYYYDWATNPDDEAYGACIQWIDTTIGDNYQKFRDLEFAALPCWSVGRLMEIIRICNLTAEKPWVYIEQDNIRAMITAITDGVNNHMLDFSKLND